MRARSTQREVVALAWPIATAMLGDTAMGLVDTRLVGGLGPSALGGVGIGTTLMWLAYSLVFGLMRGVKVRTAHAVGARQQGNAIRFAQAGVIMGVLVGAIVWLFTRDVSPVLVALGVDASTVPYGRDFLAARTFGAPAICVLSAMVQYRQGLGDARLPMYVGLGGNLLNAALSYVLIYGRFGLPALGVRGAGYGTATAEAAEACVMLVVLAREMRAARGDGAVRISFAHAAREVLQLGGPTGLHFGAETLAFTAFTAVLGSLGAREIAAHQVAMAVIRTSFLPGVAVAEAASVLVGNALGRSRLAAADRVAQTSVLVAVSFMTACGVGFALFGGAIARAFTNDVALALIVRRLLLVAAVFQALDAITIVLRGALRGAKDVRVVAFIGIAVSWVCVPGAAYVLGRMAGLGAVGGWCGFLAETSLSAILFWRRWKYGAWREAYVRARFVSHATVGAPVLT